MEILLFLQTSGARLFSCADNEISLSITVEKFPKQSQAKKSIDTLQKQLTAEANWKFHLIVIQTQLFAI